MKEKEWKISISCAMKYWRERLICRRKKNVNQLSYLLLLWQNVFFPLLRFSSSWRKETLKYNDDTYVTFSAQTSSIKWILSVRLACWTHFSTTLDANLCWDKDRTLPRTALIIWVLSSWNWRKLFLKIVIHILDFFKKKKNHNLS